MLLSMTIALVHNANIPLNLDLKLEQAQILCSCNAGT